MDIQELFQKYKSSENNDLKLNFVERNYILFENKLGNVHIRFRYYSWKKGGSRTIYGDFNANLPDIDYMAQIGTVSCALKNDEFYVPERLFKKLEKEYRKLLKNEKYAYLFKSE